jgi:hypothetical protein
MASTSAIEWGAVRHAASLASFAHAEQARSHTWVQQHLRCSWALQVNSVHLEGLTAQGDRLVHVWCVWMELLRQAGGSVSILDDFDAQLARAVAAHGALCRAAPPHVLCFPLAAAQLVEADATS